MIGRSLKFLLCLSALALSAISFALDPAKQISQYPLDNWTPEDGLSQLTVLDILQDSNGFVWAATQDGLARFDGQRFRNFSAQVEPAMGHSYVKAIAQDGSGRLWVGTRDGLSYRQHGSFHRTSLDAGGETANIHDIAVDARGVAWAAAESGLYRLDEGEARRHAGESVGERPVYSVASSLHSGVDLWVGTEGQVIGLGEGTDLRIPLPDGEEIARRGVKLLDTGSVLWIGTNQGLFRYREGIMEAIPRPAPLASRLIQALWHDEDGILWIGTEVGLYRLGADSVEAGEHRLSDRIVNALFEDREGNLWVGTNSLGLVRLWNGKFTRFDQQQGLAHPMAWSVAEEPASGAIWVGTSSGVYVLQDGRFSQPIPNDALPHPTVQGLYWDSLQRLWMLTRQGLAVFDGTEALRLPGLEQVPPEKMYSLTEGPAGTFWIGSQKGLYRYRGGEVTHLGAAYGLPEAVTRHIHRDHGGRLWVATDEGLYRESDGDFLKVGAEVGLDQTMVFDIDTLPGGEMWFATYGKGIARYNNGRYTRYSVDDGLHVESFYQIEIDDRGRLWFSSAGVAILEKSQFDAYDNGERDLLEPQLIGAGNAIETFSPSGGNAFTSLQASDGRFYYATAGGVVRVDPDEEVRNLVPPKVAVESIQRADRFVELTGQEQTEPVVFPPGEGSLEIQYAALTFRAPTLAQYRYRLTPFEEEWVDPGSRSIAYYTNIPPGDYRFEVRAANSDGIWSSSEASALLRLEPFYYQTTWFRSLMLLFALWLLYLVYRWRVRSFHAQRAELESLVERRTQELARANARLEEASLTDALTGLPNRRFLVGKMAEDAALARRAYREGTPDTNRDIVLLMMDLDHFKDINDRYGHHAGDNVLVRLAAVLRETARATDYAARWGGEEFLVVARFSERDSALAMAERFRKAVAATEFELDDDVTLNLTCSIGFASYPFLPRDPDAIDWEQTIDFADLALYVAKNRGRDQCVGIRATPETEPEDLLRRAKADLDSVVAGGELKIEASRKCEGDREQWKR